MITRHAQKDGKYRYQCKTCKILKLLPFENLRNPCNCHLTEIIHYDVDGNEVRRVFSLARQQPYVPKQTNLKEPSLFQKGINFSAAKAKHLYAGSPLVPLYVVEARFAQCLVCPLFKKMSETHGVCTHKKCGCQAKVIDLEGDSKLEWADQRCPYQGKHYTINEPYPVDAGKVGNKNPKWDRYFPLPVISVPEVTEDNES